MAKQPENNPTHPAKPVPGESRGPDAAKVGTQPSDGMTTPTHKDPAAKPGDAPVHVAPVPAAKPAPHVVGTAPVVPLPDRGAGGHVAAPFNDGVPQHGDPPSTGLPAAPVHALEVPPAAKVGLPSGGPPAKTPAKTAVVKFVGSSVPEQTVVVPAGTPAEYAQKTAIEIAMKQLGIWSAPVGPTVEWVG